MPSSEERTCYSEEIDGDHMASTKELTSKSFDGNETMNAGTEEVPYRSRETITKQQGYGDAVDVVKCEKQQTIDRPFSDGNGDLREAGPSEPDEDRFRYNIFGPPPPWLMETGYDRDDLRNFRIANRRERNKELRLSRLVEEQAKESVAENEVCDSLELDAYDMGTPQPYVIQDSNASSNKDREKGEAEGEWPAYIIAEHIRRRPKGRLIDLHPLEVAEIMEMKKSRPKKYSLKERFGKFLQNDGGGSSK
ncbi:hypothetical protein KC19_VG029900 [Ceratodon purpureus]|uniref:Uncharacterized protein n=1 Tax=Ceratodon purpureus TaxID=3225 RepID=A0A8T0HLD2_CERPU|nr:hypothetical protein KC19_VG029900 [Ceratodon purpureus]